MAPINSIDLHVHSDASDDGEWSVERLFDEALRRGVTTLAITDHNRTAACADALAAGARLGVRVISGIEIDCQQAGVNLHLLGYGIDPSAAQFEALYVELVARENDALAAKLRLLAARGIDLAAEPLIAQAGGRAVTGEQIAESLLHDQKLGAHPFLLPYRPGGDRSDNPFVNFYWDWFHQGKPCFVPVELPTLSEMIGLIHAQGGVAVLAHPGVNLGERNDLLAPMVRCGIDGIEVFNNYHSPQQMAFYLDAAQSRGLLVTCGSDFHGKTKPAISLGQCHCPWSANDIAAPLLERIAAQ